MALLTSTRVDSLNNDILPGSVHTRSGVESRLHKFASFASQALIMRSYFALAVKFSTVHVMPSILVHLLKASA